MREGRTALFRFKISDTATGTPVAGAAPAGWVDFTPDAQVESKSCGDRVGELISGSLLARPEVDLNTYHVLALNEDSTISVIDPLLGFGGTKLLAMVFLDAPGEDWALAKDGNRLFVSVPDKDQIAVVDTVAWKVVAKVAVGPRPGRLALQADGAALWATLEEGAVAVVDTAKLTVAARIPTGAGRHEIVLAADGRLAYVTNHDARTLSVIDAARRVKLRDVPLGAAPTAVAWSPLARMAYVTSEEAGTVTVVGEGGERRAGTRSRGADDGGARPDADPLRPRRPPRLRGQSARPPPADPRRRAQPHRADGDPRSTPPSGSPSATIWPTCASATARRC